MIDTLDTYYKYPSRMFGPAAALNRRTKLGKYSRRTWCLDAILSTNMRRG